VDGGASAITNWLLGPEPAGEGVASHLRPRWLFLRALGLIYFSAFYSLLFQIKGLIGPDGILPAGDYLQAVSRYAGAYRYWFAPTLFWLSSGNRMLMLVCWVGLVASILVILNILPRGMLLVCFVTFLSFVAAAQDFSGYQSDGMLLSAGFISLFFAPPGLRPGLGRAYAPSRASLFLLQLVWFTIYFESGVAKILGGDPEWRNFTAMDDYYQNGPLPTWIGWYAQQLPHRFHASTAFLTLAVELVIVWMFFLPRRFRIVCFFIVTPFEIGIILTANYTFLNYLVLSLGILLLDDRFLAPLFNRKWLAWLTREPVLEPANASAAAGPLTWARQLAEPCRRTLCGFCLGCTFYAIVALLIGMILPTLPLPRGPVRLLDPFRIANRYGLFGIMTRGRYEIEFEGTHDGKTWITYSFRYKPQDLSKPPGIYAPYQPRFDWNLWFATLGPWREYPFVVYTEERLLKNSPNVLVLMAGNPFPDSPPQKVRAVIWQYWFTDLKTKRETGMWWRRELLGLYAPALERTPDGKIAIVESSVVAPPPSP
jgi:hypothetical protein